MGFVLKQKVYGKVEAVSSHEISHVAKGDMVNLALLQGVLNTFVIFLAPSIGYTVDRALFKNERQGNLLRFHEPSTR